jgi:uncharacterized protein YkwD
MNEENKRYNPRGGAIHPEPTSAERNAVPDNSNEILRRRLLQKIDEKNRLINLTKAMSGAPVSEGGMSREKANKTIQLLNKDISNLEKELKELESEPKNLKINSNSESSLLKPLDDETKSSVFKRLEENKNSPPKVEEKYRKEYAGTTFHNDSIIQDIPVPHPKKYLNWNVIVSILLIIILSSLLFFVISNSNSQNTYRTPSNFSDNITNKIVNPVPALTNTSNKTGTVTQSKFKHTYIDSEGNVHEVTDYTSQGGSKYDVIIKNTSSISKSENVLIVNNVSETNKINSPKNDFTNFITNLEKEIVGWWDENKPKAEFNSATYDIENIVFNKVNEERKKRGLQALIWDSKIAEVARLHSLDMANRSYFSHENPEGEDPTMRAKRQGIATEIQKGSVIMVGIAENIGMMPTGNVEGYGYVSSSNDVADAMMQSWMNSPGHRANILNADYNFIGVGVAYNGYGTYYLTQDFK